MRPCRLCGELKSLRHSHIFPKFYWDWLKQTGSGYFREPRKPNLKVQDGHKRYLLCHDCETRFSAWETSTAKHVFKPIVADPTKPVSYGAWFYRFLISVLWRNLAINLDDRPDIIHPEFRAVEETWRTFLLDGQPLGRCSRLHVFVTDIPLPGSPKHSVYLTRDADFQRCHEGPRLDPIRCVLRSSPIFLSGRRLLRRSLRNGSTPSSLTDRAFFLLAFRKSATDTSENFSLIVPR